MKDIKAILQPHAVSRVLRALEQLPHSLGFAPSHGLGQGRGQGLAGAVAISEERLFLKLRKMHSFRAGEKPVRGLFEDVREHARTGTLKEPLPC